MRACCWRGLTDHLATSLLPGRATCPREGGHLRVPGLPNHGLSLSAWEGRGCCGVAGAGASPLAPGSQRVTPRPSPLPAHTAPDGHGSGHLTPQPSREVHLPWPRTPPFLPQERRSSNQSRPPCPPELPRGSSHPIENRCCPLWENGVRKNPLTQSSIQTPGIRSSWCEVRVLHLTPAWGLPWSPHGQSPNTENQRTRQSKPWTWREGPLCGP